MRRRLSPVVVVGSEIRYAVRQITLRELPELVVLSTDEISPGVRIQYESEAKSSGSSFESEPRKVGSSL